MNERSKELLSAYLDDALEAPEAADLAVACSTDESLLAVAARYRLIGELLRGEAPASAAEGDLLKGIRARLRDQAFEAPLEAELDAFAAQTGTHGTVVPLAPRRRRRWTRPLAGAAVAAGIAVLAVTSLRTVGEATGPAATDDDRLAATAASATLATAGATGGDAASHAAGAMAVAAGHAGQRVLRWSVSEPAVERRLNMYLVNHSEVTRSGTHGMLPYARVVGYRSAAGAEQR